MCNACQKPVETCRCSRCHTVVPKDNLDALDDLDCRPQWDDQRGNTYVGFDGY